MCSTILKYFVCHITIKDGKRGSTLFEALVFQYYWFNKHSWWQCYFYSDSFFILFYVKWCLECNWHHPKTQFLWFRHMYYYFLWKTSKKKNLCHSCRLLVLWFVLTQYIWRLHLQPIFCIYERLPSFKCFSNCAIWQTFFAIAVSFLFCVPTW